MRFKSNKQRKAVMARMHYLYSPHGERRFNVRRVGESHRLVYFKKGLRKTDKKYLGQPVYEDKEGNFYVRQALGSRKIRVHPKFQKFERCVKAVKRKDGKYNPYAVCRHSTGYKGSTRPKQYSRLQAYRKRMNKRAEYEI